MKDFADGQWKILGEGAIDFGPVFQAIRDIGYDGWVSADEESGGDVVDGMRKCAAYLSRLAK
jgi:inosose dehydratase